MEVTGEVADASRIASFLVSLDGADCTPPLDLGERKSFAFKLHPDTTRLEDGKHTLTVTAADAQGRSSTAAATFYTENRPPVIALTFEPNRVDQGRTLVVRLQSNRKLYDLTGKLWEQEFPFFKTDDGFVSIVGVRASCPPGDYPVEVTGFDAYDKPLSLKGTVSVTDGGYIQERITIAAADKKALFDPALEEKKMLEYRKVQTIITRVRQEQLWAGTFVVPAPGKVTSPFGTHRTFSTGGSERHMGIDIANKEGTPVRAANRGVVMLAEELLVRGKAVIIDHGRGVFTIYNHLSGITVKPGDAVEKGHVIGYIGSTGLATGPHLHWEMRVFRWVIDPMQWTTTSFTYRDAQAEAEAVAAAEAAYQRELARELPPPLEPTGGDLKAGEMLPDEGESKRNETGV